jgi:hypothetical protein
VQLIEHAEPSHEGVPLTLLQVLPHVPQLVVVVVLSSHPSVSLFPLQSPHPDSHVPEHVPLVHRGEGT